MRHPVVISYSSAEQFHRALLAGLNDRCAAIKVVARNSMSGARTRIYLAPTSAFPPRHEANDDVDSVAHERQLFASHVNFRLSFGLSASFVRSSREIVRARRKQFGRINMTNGRDKCVSVEKQVNFRSLEPNLFHENQEFCSLFYLFSLNVFTSFIASSTRPNFYSRQIRRENNVLARCTLSFIPYSIALALSKICTKSRVPGAVF